MIYPWQQTQWQQVMQAKQAGRLPHALLFSGIAGTGKMQFADAYSQALVCQHPTSNYLACNECHLCRLVIGRVHPDVRWLEPEKPGHAIKVDQIREISEFCQHSALQGSHRIAIIHPADSMNTSAANALLKTLEEPSPNTLLILISSQASRLLPTVLSRCQRIDFFRPSREEATDWLSRQVKDFSDQEMDLLLEMAGGAPLAALAMAQQGLLGQRHDLFQALCHLKKQPEDVLTFALKYKEMDNVQFFDLMMTWLMDLLRAKYPGIALTNKDFTEQIVTLSEKHTSLDFLRMINHLTHLRHDISRGINLNKQLMIESVLIRWSYQTLG